MLSIILTHAKGMEVQMNPFFAYFCRNFNSIVTLW